MPSQASGQAPRPSAATRRPPRKPKAVGLVGDVGHFVGHAGGTAKKSLGHAAHDARHAAGKVASALNPFD